MLFHKEHISVTIKHLTHIREAMHAHTRIYCLYLSIADTRRKHIRTPIVQKQFYMNTAIFHTSCKNTLSYQ
jgi:hypothetical protein